MRVYGGIELQAEGAANCKGFEVEKYQGVKLMLEKSSLVMKLDKENPEHVEPFRVS